MSEAVLGLVSAVIGGLIVLAGQLVQHRNEKADRIEERRYNQEALVAELAMSVVNWFEMDKHRVVAASGGSMPAIETNHPVHKLAAAMRRTDPAYADLASQILNNFRAYCDITRVFLPAAEDEVARDKFANEFAAEANTLMKLLDKAIETVLPSTGGKK